MKTTLSTLLLAMTVTLQGCAGAEPTETPADTELGALAPQPASMPPEANRMGPAYLPTPFSAAEIRAAATPGAFRKFQNQTPATTRVQTMIFLAGDGSGAPVEGVIADADGKVLNRVVSSATTWEEFQGHASYEELGTTLTRGRVHVLAGDFDCWIYTTVDTTGADVEASFALELPGPPVLMVTTRGGAPVMRVELLDYGPR